jgi:hypothetical protein
MQGLIIEGTRLIREDIGLLSWVVVAILAVQVLSLPLQIAIACKLFF